MSRNKYILKKYNLEYLELVMSFFKSEFFLITSRIKSFVSKKDVCNLFFLSLVVYTVFFFCIISSNYEYLDDRMRGYFGYYYWEVEGRFFLYFLFKTLSLDNILRSIWPVPQCMAILLMALVNTLIFCYYKTGYIKNILITSPIFCNPLFLENISYQFDSVGMTAGYISAIIAAVIAINNNSYRSVLYSCLFLIFSFFCYQVSLNVFICTFFPLLCFIANNESLKKSFYKCFQCLFILFISMIVYKIISLLLGIYFHEQRDFSISHDFYNIYNNFSLLFGSIYLWCGHKYIIEIAGIVVFIFIYSLIYKKSFPIFLISILYCFCGGIGIIGPIALLKEIPIWPRIYLGMGAFIFSCSLCSILLFKIKWGAIIIKLFLLLMFLHSFLLSCIYGNLLHTQKEYENYHLQKIVDQVNYNSTKYNLSSLIILNKLPRASLVEKAAQKLPIVDKLISSPIDNQWQWINNSLYGLGLDKNISISLQSDSNEECIGKGEKGIYICNDKIYYK